MLCALAVDALQMRSSRSCVLLRWTCNTTIEAPSYGSTTPVGPNFGVNYGPGSCRFGVNPSAVGDRLHGGVLPRAPGVDKDVAFHRSVLTFSGLTHLFCPFLVLLPETKIKVGISCSRTGHCGTAVTLGPGGHPVGWPSSPLALPVAPIKNGPL